jgi:ABC-type cobalamin/Fe3+-siderophores transport system ATPase subunit
VVGLVHWRKQKVKKMSETRVVERNVAVLDQVLVRVFSLIIVLLIFELRMNWSNNLSKKLRNSYNAMKRLLREINI